MGAYKYRVEAYLSVIRNFIGEAKLAIADIGCGSGVFAKRLSEGNFVAALDINRKPLETINGSDDLSRLEFLLERVFTSRKNGENLPLSRVCG